MGQQIINNGETGLQVRTKINANFTELYTGKDAVTVNTYADLPDPTTVPQQKYWVLTSTGVYLVNRKSKGCYYSDGATWIYLGEFPTTADQVGNVPAGGIAATDLQAAINELDVDKLAASHAGSGGTAHSNAVASGSAGFMTGADKAKLDGVAAGATANSSDAVLLARANHTGTQAIATILAASSSRIFGRSTAGSGVGEELTAAQVRTMINVADGATANSSDAVLLARANHTGTQAIDTVFAAATSRFFGRITAGSGVGEELTGTQATSLLDVFTSTLKGLVPSSGGGTTNFLRADGSWAVPPVTDGDKGDITVSSGGTAWAIDAGAVTNAKLANVATATFKGRTTAGSGSPEDLNGTQATALLDVFTSTLKGLVPSSGGGTTDFLRADGSWAVPPGAGGGVSDGDKGDITVSSSGTTWTIDLGAVTFGKIQNLSGPKTLVGRYTAGAGSPEEITIGAPGAIEISGTELDVFVDLGRRPVLAYQAEGVTTTISAFGGAALTATGTATASSAIATTNDYTSTRLLEYLVTVASTSAVAGFRYPVSKWFLGNVTNRGGFRMACTFAPATGVATATNRLFVGMSNHTTAPVDAEPSNSPSIVGVGWDAADTNIQIMHNDNTGTATKIDLGASFPVPTVDRTKTYTLELFATPNSPNVSYRFWDNSAPSTIASGTLTSDLPAVNTLLSPRGFMSVGGTSSVIGIALSRLVIQG